MTQQIFLVCSLGIFEANHNIDYPFPDIVSFGVYWFAPVHDREHHKRSAPIVAFTVGEAAETFVGPTTGFPTNFGELIEFATAGF